MHSLPLFLKLKDRPVILIGEGDAADAKRRLLERAGARIVDEETPAALAIVALADDDETAVTVDRLHARGILVNAVDRPALSDFTLPAIVDRDPVLIAIGTGGTSAGLAKALRQRLETLLPARLGELARALHRARPALRARFPHPTDRRRAIDAALDPGGPLDPLDESASVDTWLAEARADDARCITIRLRSGDPDDLTLAEARWLGRADRIHHDPTVPAAILTRARADAARTTAPAPEKPLPGVTIILIGPSRAD